MSNLFLKQLTLKNFCNYENHTFSFVNDDQTPYRFICFYGPNGIGKTTLLEAILLLTMNRFGRGIDRIRQSLLKYVYDDDYDPLASKLCPTNNPSMFIEGIYVMDDKDYIIQMNETGWTRNDFVPLPTIEDPTTDDYSTFASQGPWGEDYLRYLQRIAHSLISDSDLYLNKFQLVSQYANAFESIMTEVMRWPAKCLVSNSFRTEERMYCTDFIIQKHKKSGRQTNVHFKRMSAGERKIAKSFSDLMNLMHSLSNPGNNRTALTNWPCLLLIDNVEMHTYYDRHVRLVHALKNAFHHQQIFATTHSHVLIQHAKHKENNTENELYIDVESINS